MSITLILIPSILACGILANRIFELKTEKITPLTSYIRHFDEKVERFFSVFDAWIVSSSDMSRATQQKAGHMLLAVFERIVLFLKQGVDIVHDKIQGKKVVDRSKNPSFYLQSMAEHKKNTQQDRQDTSH